MRLRWFAAHTADNGSPGTDQVLDDSETVRRQLLATTEKLADYTASLQKEIERLKRLADTVGDDDTQR